MVWIETPTNPTMQLIDIEAVVKAVREKASPECFVVVDNTFMSSYFQVSLGIFMCSQSPKFSPIPNWI